MRYVVVVAVIAFGGGASANPPVASYVFPAGGQRGTTLDVRVGGLFLHGPVEFVLSGRGANADRLLKPAKRVWFEGPVLPIPESQQQEDYPADLTGRVVISPDAPTGAGRGKLFTSQGGCAGLVFVVGELPEVVEKEIDGDAIAVPVTLPVTANGRIFPREDLDVWEFDAIAGKQVTAFAHAASLNSPLVPRLEILDAAGTVVAEPMVHAVAGADASVRFTPKVAGKYRVRIADARTLGGPAYVYRLTITTANVPDIDFPLKANDGLKDAVGTATPQTAPVALNGQVERPGIVGEWKLDLKKGQSVTLDLFARRGGSPLCGVVTLTDSAGKVVGKAESDGTADPAPLAFTPPADGLFTVSVRERFTTRAGPAFAYRLRVTNANADPGFRLTLATDVVTLARGKSVSVPVRVERFGGFKGPVVLSVADLPKGVTATAVSVPAGQVTATVGITAAADAKVEPVPLKLRGVGFVGLYPLVTGAVVPGTRFLPEETRLRLAVAFPTPFKIIDQYVMTSAPRGEVYRRKYEIDRRGFDGPIEVRLADKQARHLQGVTGPTLTIPPGQTAFEYPATLPPWMEMGRTCRVCVLATATVRDPIDGREHVVSFSSTDQNQQMIVVVGPGRLDLAVGKGTVLAVPGEVRVPVKVSRGTNLSGAAKVEVLIPPHLKGVTAAALTIPDGVTAGEVVLTISQDAGPFNMPLVVRATVETKDTPVVAEGKVEIVK